MGPDTYNTGDIIWYERFLIKDAQSKDDPAGLSDEPARDSQEVKDALGDRTISDHALIVVAPATTPDELAAAKSGYAWYVYEPYAFGSVGYEPTDDEKPINLYSYYTSIKYKVNLVNVGPNTKVENVAELDYEVQSGNPYQFTLPDPVVTTNEDGTTTDSFANESWNTSHTSFNRPGYSFLGWSISASPYASKIDTQYYMPGESVGAGTRMGAMSGSSTTPAVLYAHWTRTPVD